MRIGIDGTLLDRKVTGSERYIHNLFSSLCLFGAHNNYTIYTSHPIFPPESLSHNAAERSFASRSEMISEEFLSESKPAMQLYHMTWFGANYIDLLPLYLAPVSLLTVLDLMLFRYSDYFHDPAAHPDYRERCRLAISASDLILAISSHTKSEILANFPIEAEKVKVIPLGTDSRFHKLSDEESISRVRSRHGLDESFILYVATDYPHKNHKNLLRAFQNLLKKKRLSVKLVLVGARYYLKNKEELEELAGPLLRDKDIVWLDHVDDEELNALYNAADLFVYPSFEEGFGLPLLEAMACGTPVVASNAASIPEVVGDAAMLFDPANVRDMAAVIEKVWQEHDLRMDLVERGHKRCADLSWKKTAEATLLAYEEAVQIKRPVKARSNRSVDDAVLSGILKDYQRLNNEFVDLSNAVELREKRLQMVLGSRGFRYYRKLKENIRRFTNLRG